MFNREREPSLWVSKEETVPFGGLSSTQKRRSVVESKGEPRCQVPTARRDGFDLHIGARELQRDDVLLVVCNVQ